MTKTVFGREELKAEIHDSTKVGSRKLQFNETRLGRATDAPPGDIEVTTQYHIEMQASVQTDFTTPKKKAIDQKIHKNRSTLGNIDPNVPHPVPRRAWHQSVQGRRLSMPRAISTSRRTRRRRGPPVWQCSPRQRLMKCIKILFQIVIFGTKQTPPPPADIYSNSKYNLTVVELYQINQNFF